MRDMRRTTASIIAVVLVGAGLSCQSSAFAQAGDAAAAPPKILLTATVDLLQPPFFGVVEEGPAPEVAAASAETDAKPGAATTARSDRAARNLAAIAKAFISYEDAYRCFPPAALIGPDGRAWHSWRVLILPFLDDPSAQAIRSEYSFEEPWDGPRNKRFLDTMPDVYADQPEGRPTDGFTRYAAVTGAGTMFSPDGVAFDPAAKPRVIGRGVRSGEVVDGAATTLMVGTLRSDAKIPWTKPEDVVVTKDPPPLGREGFFGTPYESEKGTFALFVRVDGGLAGISDTIAPDAFRALATIAERDGVGIWKTPGVFSLPAPGAAEAGDASAAPQARPGQQMTVVIFEEDGVPKARFSK